MPCLTIDDMSKRSLSDVPNRIVRIFLERVGEQYDLARGYRPFLGLTPEVRATFDGRCAYCRADVPDPDVIAEHVVPINRTSVGLHAWGNVVPSCKPCNRLKKQDDWRTFVAMRHQASPQQEQAVTASIEAFIAQYRYNPDVAALSAVAEQLYRYADRQSRELIDFATVAFAPSIETVRADAEGTPTDDGA